ncbi:hypothetical protein [Microbacterium hominis]|uniref:hypothetical protein n=1 Tax=Microbacterium hominis TaxID=162426 RepID=UPI0012E02204|nr:hypothetical protein [Microbacterium hominis]
MSNPIRSLWAWLRFGTVIAARAALSVLFGLTFWAVAPLAVGWQTTTVMTGSMQPAIQPGDLVVSRPIDPIELRPGQVVLVSDPDHPGRLRLHRLDRVDGAELVTKGDANPQVDSSPVPASGVRGIGVLRVPWIGTPIRDAHDANTAALAGTILGLVAVIAIAAAPASSRRAEPPPAPPTDSRRGDDRAPRRGRLRTRAASTTLTSVALVVATAFGAATPAYAAFSDSTRAVAELRTATARDPSRLTCTNNFGGTVTIRWQYEGETPSAFDVLVDGYGAIATVGAGERSITLGARIPTTYGLTSVVRIRTALTPTWKSAATASVNVTTIKILWGGFASCG